MAIPNRCHAKSDSLPLLRHLCLLRHTRQVVLRGLAITHKYLEENDVSFRITCKTREACDDYLFLPTKNDVQMAAIAAAASTNHAWIDTEVGGCHFKDVRLAKRFGKLLGMMSDGIGESVPYACQDWANTKAAYRFFSNAQVSEEQIMAGHFQATRGRLSEPGRKILMVHDTCEFSFQREKDSQLGLLGRPACGKGKDGRLKHVTVRGILMHSSLALTLDGLPLGLAAIKFWTRKQFKGCNALKKKITPPGPHR